MFRKTVEPQILVCKGNEFHSHVQHDNISKNTYNLCQNSREHLYSTFTTLLSGEFYFVKKYFVVK